MELPRHILDRVDRVYAYHRASKLAFGMAGRRKLGPPLDRPLFPSAPRVGLPTTLLDAPLGTLAVLESSVDALPESFVAPPQGLKTLASWLYLADGILSRPRASQEIRTVDGEDEIFPVELYVASFAMADLEPGLYHYDSRAFCLRTLREGAETLSLMKRGRPDLEFLKRAPGAILVSTGYTRAAAGHGRRAYRTALVESGKVVQNLVTAAAGLGIQTVSRLRLTDSSMRELIGVAPDADFAQEESVQAMVVWADRSQHEAIGAHTASPKRQPHARAAFREGPRLAGTINEGGVAVASLDVTDLALPSIARVTLPSIARDVAPVASPAAEAILAVHEDCVAPGVAIREIRPPLTELSPLPEELPSVNLGPTNPHDTGLSLRTLLLATPHAKAFGHVAISRDALRAISKCAFGSGTYFPLLPSGLHTALVRAFWIVHHVAGTEPGVWYHHAGIDEWCLLRTGDARFDAQYLALEHAPFGDASAVCIQVADLHALLTRGGPDTYRLAHLEAGTAARRLTLAAGGFGLGALSTSLFFDDEVRKFLGLGHTGWEPLVMTAVGEMTK